MHPVIAFAWGGEWMAISSYRLFMGLAALASIGLAMWLASRRGFPVRKVGPLLLMMAVTVPVGARLQDAATKAGLYLEHPEQLLSLELSGFSLYGGILLAMVVGLVACRVLALDLLLMADIVAPAFGLAIAVMRTGCFLAGCSFGTVSDLPWAVTFPVGSNAHLLQLLQGGLFASLGQPLPVHPTQLYEAAAGVLGMVLAFWVLRSNVLPGTALAALAVWFNAFRLGNHFLRVQETPLSVPAGFYPVLYALLICVGAAWLFWRYAYPNASARTVRRPEAASIGATG